MIQEIEPGTRLELGNQASEREEENRAKARISQTRSSRGTRGTRRKGGLESHGDTTSDSPRISYQREISHVSADRTQIFIGEVADVYKSFDFIG